MNESDTAVAYRLYRETGKIINLADWYTAFCQSSADEHTSARKRTRDDLEANKEGGAAEDGEPTAAGQVEAADNPAGQDRRKQARFLRALGDLAHVGFLQPTRKKSEHVSKSVF